MASKLMTIEEIQTAYDRLSHDNNMRSLSAVLRIGAEQIERRGKLGLFRNFVFVTGILAIGFTIFAPLAPDHIKPQLQVWQIIAAVLCVLCVGVLWRVRNNMEQYIADEQTIRVMMVEASQKIVRSPSFTPTPLSEELRGTLRNAVTHVKAGQIDELNAIIDRH